MELQHPVRVGFGVVDDRLADRTANRLVESQNNHIESLDLRTYLQGFEDSLRFLKPFVGLISTERW